MAQQVPQQITQPYAFKVRQRFFTFIRKFYDIFDLATEQKVLVAKTKILTFFPQIIVEDLAGREVVRIKSNWLRTSWKIYQGDNLIGEVKFPFIRFCGIKFTVFMAGNAYEASDIIGWNFTAKDRNGNVGFLLDRKLFRIRDTYQVVVYPPLEPIFALAAALTIDMRYYERR